MNPFDIKAIIYDCDGVLFDSRTSNEAYYNHILEHFGQPPLTKKHRHAVQSLTAAEVIALIFADNDLLAKALAFERTLGNDMFMHLVQVEPNIREVLVRVRQKCLTAIATNRGKSLHPLLAYHNLDTMFDVKVTSYDVTHSKPHPECLHIILGNFHLLPEEALYIGDSEVDQALCERAGVPFVAYKNRSLKATYHFDDHLDLLAILQHLFLP
jgi:phosphoglycolate phosphatase-like HAD superfamily hydrolase